MNSAGKTYNRGNQLLQKLIAGSISSAEMNELKELAQQDPFLQDAVEGYQGTDQIDHQTNIEEIKRRIGSNMPSARFWYQSATAILLLATIGIVLYQNNVQSNQLNESLPPVSESVESEELSKKSQTLEYENDLSREEPNQVLTEERLAIAADENRSDKPSTNSEEEPLSFRPESDSGLAQIEKKDDPTIGAAPSEESAPSVRSSRKYQAIQIPKDTLPQQDLDAIVSILNEESKTSENRSDILRDERSDSLYSISGIVTDLTGNPLAGVQINLQNTDIQTITDLEGTFTMDIPTNNGILDISYLGYQDTSISIQALTDNSIELRKNNAHDQVVITGSGPKYSSLKTEQPKEDQDNSLIVEPSIGFEEFELYIEQNKQKTKAATDEQVSGEVILSFEVMPSGKLKNITVIKSLGYGLDEEAIRLLEEGPRWKTIPKRQHVTTQYTVHFE